MRLRALLYDSFERSCRTRHNCVRPSGAAGSFLCDLISFFVAGDLLVSEDPVEFGDHGRVRGPDAVAPLGDGPREAEAGVPPRGPHRQEGCLVVREDVSCYRRVSLVAPLVYQV